MDRQVGPSDPEKDEFCRMDVLIFIKWSKYKWFQGLRVTVWLTRRN